MKLSDIGKDWRHTRLGVWHKPFFAKRGNKRVKEWAIHYEMICVGCGQKYISQYRHVKHCTQLCNNTTNKQFGKNHWRWNGGIAETSKGYNMIRRDTRFYVPQHRFLMEQHLGRKLTAHEVVHHINENKSDNRLENLQVLTRAEHARHHQTGKKKLGICRPGHKGFIRKSHTI